MDGQSKVSHYYRLADRLDELVMTNDTDCVVDELESHIVSVDFGLIAVVVDDFDDDYYYYYWN